MTDYVINVSTRDSLILKVNHEYKYEAMEQPTKKQKKITEREKFRDEYIEYIKAKSYYKHDGYDEIREDQLFEELESMLELFDE